MADTLHTPSDVSRILSSKKNKCTSFLHLNTQSARNKDDHLSALLSSFGFPFDIVMLSETWYRNDEVLQVSGYVTHYLNRRDKKGGGVLLLTKSTLHCEVLKDFTRTTTDFEILTVQHGRSIFSVVYRPPVGNVVNFLEYIDNLLSWVNDNDYRLVLGGDININMFHDSSLRRRTVRVLESNACTNTISTPTRIQGNCESLLDIFVTNIDAQNVESGVITAQVSDHLPIFLIVNSSMLPLHPSADQHYTFQDINPFTLDKFRDEISRISWQDVYDESDCDKAYELFLSAFKNAYAKSFKRKTKKARKARKPWINDSALKLIKQKDALFKQFLRTRDAVVLAAFKKLRNKVNGFLRAAKTQYFEKLFPAETIMRTDVTWRKLNSLLHGNQQADNLEELTVDSELISGTALADAFNNYFVSLVNSSYDPQCIKYLKPKIVHSAFLNPTDTQEIQSMFRSIRNSKSCDIDDLQIRPAKHVLDLIGPVLEHVYNLSLANGTFPRRMQIAKVTALFKSGDKNKFSNYRPISILPIFSKCLEKLINVRITSFCNKHNLLTDFQFGFRKGRSTELALLTQKEIILQGFEENLVTLGIFIDFSKAFDTINHNTLLTKLDIYGFRGTFLKLIRSYLQYRYQTVVIGNHYSKNLPIRAGVPQGSILGPLLFNIYINDLTNIKTTARFVIYADDTSLFITSRNVAELISTANDTLEQINKWSLSNSLTINVAKTKGVLFQPKNKKQVVHGCLQIGTSGIEVVPSVKSLGVIFQENMLWNEHVNTIANKLARVTGILVRLRLLLPLKVKLLLYNSLFLSHINYCHLVWGNTTSSNINILFLLQKKAVRTILNAPFDAHTDPIFDQLNIIPLKAVYNTILQKRFLIERKNSMGFLEQLSRLTLNSSTFSTRHKETWHVPHCRTNYGKQMLRHALPSLLNSLH